MGLLHKPSTNVDLVPDMIQTPSQARPGMAGSHGRLWPVGGRSGAARDRTYAQHEAGWLRNGWAVTFGPTPPDPTGALLRVSASFT